MNYRKIWTDAFGPIPKDENGRSYEIHHIDGNRDNNALSNLTCVTIQEHYDIHYSKGEYYAANLIANRMGDKIGPVKSWNMPEKYRKAISLRQTGDGNVSKRPEVRKKISETKKGRKKSAESEAKRLASRMGYKHSEITKQKLRKPKEKIQCVHCGLVGGISQMKRWHFNNCKYKK